MIKLKPILDATHYDSLYEGLILSHPKVGVIRFLKKYDNKVNISNVHDNFNGFVFNFRNDKLTNDDVGKILKTLENVYGWKPIRFSEMVTDYETTEWKKMLSTGYSPLSIIVQIEPIHPVQLNKKDYPKYLYHISPEMYKHRILKKGLIPKSMNKKFKHKDRIYFTDTLKNDYHIRLADLLARTNGVVEWSVYGLKVSDLSSNFTLFNDELTDNSYFTKDNIQPGLIKHIEDFEV